MNNLSTRKIVLGLLVTLVLAFSVQGIVDALTPSVRFSQPDLKTLNQNSTITVSGIRTTPNNTDVTNETLTITATGAVISSGGTNFGASETWTEDDDDNRLESSDDQIPSSVTITFPNAQEVTVEVEWTTSDGLNAAETDDVSRTYYVVDTTATATVISLTDDGDNGYEIKTGGIQALDFTATPQSGITHIPVRFTSTSRGRLFVRRTVTGEATRQFPTSPTTTLDTSSNLGSNTSVYLNLTGTSTVTLSHPSENPDSVVYIYGRPTIAITDGNNQEGVTEGRLGEALSVRVRDSRGSNVAGVPVQFSIGTSGDSSSTIENNQFIPVPGTTVYVTTGDVLGTSLDPDTRTIEATSTHPAAANNNASIFVQTNSAGVAEVYLKLGTAQTGLAATAARVTYVNATLVESTVDLLSPFRHEIRGNQRIPTIDIVSGNNQRADASGNIEMPLVVVVKNRGQRIAGETVTFTTSKGFLEDDDQGPLKSVSSMTNSSGETEADFFLGNSTGAAEVVASISGNAGTEANPVPYAREELFAINGTASSPPPPRDDDDDDDDDTTTGRTITVSRPSLSGAPGAVVNLGVLAGNRTVTVTGNAAFTAAGGTVSSTGAIRDVTLPNTAGTAYSLTVEATGYDDTTVSVTVTAAPSTTLGTLTVSREGAQIGTQQQILVRASPVPSSTLAFTVTSGGFRVGSGEITTTGSGRAIITVPAASGLYTLTVSATGYDPVQITLNASAQPTTDTTTTTTTTTTTAGEPSRIQISGGVVRTGTVNQQLDLPLAARVLDALGRGVPDTRVTFRVVSGKGRLSQVGNGLGIRVQTDRSGYARANYTPTAEGTSTVRANAGVTQTVTFTISTGSAPPPTETPDTSTPRATTRSPVVHVNASSRPPMLWVEDGAIYALVGASPQRFAPSVDNAQNLAVGGSKVYWTEATGESGGTINSANLDGSGVTELESILATPMGIAVDTAGSKLYWTNSRGRIQSANLDGSGITNVIPGGLDGAMDIALAGGNAYWTQGGNVRFVNLSGVKQIRNVSTGTDTAGSLAIANGKVYWTEATGTSSGTINSANLGSTDSATQLASILAAPSGIAVDTSRSKLLWTNSRGRIQSANLDGSGITNVVDGLGSPGDMVLSNSITAPAATTTTTTTTTSDKYDVNGDGSVDSMDVDALIVAVAAGVTDAKYDVNGDGKVDIFDVSAVSTKRSGGAAGAPTLLGTKLSTVQIDRLQEQIDLLIASNDRSPDTMRILIYLQQLIVMARPEKTQLLANYPNPFNPETWIPYELATDTDVRLTIYNTHGVVIRTLELGHQSSGYYTGRDRAAYWDGRNAYGEQVASGIYFYQFETDTMSSMRKMVILK